MKNLFKMLNPRNFSTEISSYGLDFSLKSQLVRMLSFIVGLLGLGYILGLTTGYLLVLLLFTLFISPHAILSTYRLMYEQSRFSDVADYIEQILFSFKRRSKILTSLQDTLRVFSDPKQRMHIDIEKAINILSSSSRDLGNESIYKVALDEIKNDFDCKQLELTHKFLCSVEHNGGNYDSSANILINTRNQWVTRVKEDQKDREGVKKGMTLSIGASLILMTMTTFLVPSGLVNLKTNNISHLATMIAFIIDMSLWLFVRGKLNKSLLEVSTSKKDLLTLYNHVMKPQKPTAKKTILNLVVLGGLVGVAGIVTRSILILGSGVGLVMLILTNPKRVAKARRKRLRREVEKAFPEWMISIALLLQTENVHIAISKSIKDAPELLQGELGRLIDGIDRNPISVDPYLDFFSTLNSEDVNSSMKLLYSMSQFGADEMNDQIQSMVSRNSLMQDKADKMKAEDYTAGIKFFTFLPMIVSVLKMFVDGALLFSGLMQLTAIK